MKISSIVNQNTNGWKSEVKIESTIQTMIDKNIGAYLIQETWALDYEPKELRGYLILHHNYDEGKRPESTQQNAKLVRRQREKVELTMQGRDVR